MKEKKRMWTILVAVWMVVIFLFSAQPSDESSKESLFVGRMVGQIFVKDFEEWPEEEQEAFAEAINYPVRKTAHATEYAILGIFVFMRCRCQDTWSRKRMIATAWGISTVYAATDEFHQIFVPGRAGMVTDVMIDSSGALAGILLAALAGFIIIGRNRRTEYGS
ncbi:VanZ family protein [Drancourtella sp. An12]|uniref:VanZ family protein n=1 Tax=Drancourtella sp. An12 TaxID=1965548 RepID=UPI001FA8866B|nr:VanZ family protein [Drancourtella sp. An12]